ncbi:hypothetical protein SAMN05880593_13552 [Rhizobium sp. RU36D]|nr:hypothetical protein SAMN05880593_13552 [Rhizobium sp. RU36D]
MATMQKVKPCPECGNADLVIYKYDNGWQHVECDDCHYLGPGCGNKIEAVRQHNARCATTPPTREAI